MKKLAMCLIFFAGCTSAQWGKVTSLGDSAHIVCYSGGKEIYNGYSTGKVSNEEQSDGYFFKEKHTGDFKEVSGNCVISYD